MKNYIQELLFNHNSVIIPGFGGFTTAYKPAFVDHVKGVIFPPSKDLKFNRYLTINDGVLIQYICDKKGITREEAELIVKDQVAEMKETLANRDMLEFPKVGRLYLDFEGNYRFLQDNTNYNRASFGLPTVGFYPVTRNRRTPVQEAPQPREAAAVIDLGGSSSRSRVVSGWFQRNAPYIVAATFLILAGTFLIIDSDNNNTQTGLTAFTKPVSEERINIKPSREEEDTDLLHISEEDMIDVPLSNKAAEKTRPVEEETSNDLSQEETSSVIADQEIETEGATTSPNLKEAVVIIGSFGSEQNVKRLIKKIYRKGYEPFTLKKGKLTKVGVTFGYDEPGEIERERANVADIFNVNAWVLQ